MRGDIIDLAFAVTDRFSTERLDWGDCGPRLLNALVLTYPKLAPVIMEPNFANPIDWWNCPKALFDENSTLTENVWFLHCYNETWRRAGVDKNCILNSKSVYGEQYNKYKNYL